MSRYRGVLFAARSHARPHCPARSAALACVLCCVWGLAVARGVAVAVEAAADPNSMGYALLLSQRSFGPVLKLAWPF